MYEQLYNQSSSNAEIIINFITFDTADEMKKQYMKFNADNPNIFFDIDEIEKYEKHNRYLEFKKSLSTLYKKYFKQDDDKIYNIDEFIKKLETYEYLDYFEKITDALEYLIEKNKSFYDQYYKTKSAELFGHKKIQEFIQEKKIFSLKGNNFIEWLMCEDQDVPHFIFSHKFGKSNQTTKKTLKNVKTSYSI